MGNIFRKSAIEGAKSSIFKGGVKEKGDLAKTAGSSGLSARQMDKALKERGYDPGRRSGIISKISGDDEKKGPSKADIRRNILESRRSFEAGQAAEEVREARYSFGGQGARTRSGAEKVLGRAGGGVKGTATRRFGLGGNSSGFAGQKNSGPSSPSPSPRAGSGIKPNF
ncbi:MAG: hypothetical protein PHQ42_03485 [Patescibacteria group bacterium]|nr:hypothetical protein [Patescibacteria group bacterium]